jgi:isoleucyl-tRNA synthetase
MKHGRFGDWLENNVDWALSRDRYWGTPLPIWRCEHGHDTVVGSIAELSALARRDLADLDLHRPYVDELTFACPSGGCSSTASRLAPVLDAWFDSGAMPSAQHHHPFENEAIFGDSFPADFICEAIDQTRGWFYSLLAVNTLVFDSTPYRNVLSLAHIVDQDGQKMSKSRGNVIDPWEIMDAFGADSLRWYFFSAGSPWTNRRVYEEGIREAARKTLITLWNVFSFFATYADIDGWEPGAAPAPGEQGPRHVLDRWILSKLSGAVAAVTSDLDDFDALGAATTLSTFVDDLSNWYVRRSRARFWGSKPAGPGDATDIPSGDAHATLYRCLVTTAQLLAPFCPLLADEIFVTLTGKQSVHLADWPEPTDPVDNGIETQMDAARRLVGLGRSAREEARVRVRQPLRRALLLHPGIDLDDEVRGQVVEELNVKALEDVETLSELMTWTVTPNFRVLGPRLGKKVNEVKQALADADGSELRRRLDHDGFVEVAGERLGPEDVEIRAHRHEDFALSQDAGWAVALDLEVDVALEIEGAARQLARDLNDLRKQLGLALTDRVAVRIADPGPKVRAAVEAHRRWIAGETLAEELALGSDGALAAGGSHELDLDGERVRVELRVAR